MLELGMMAKYVFLIDIKFLKMSFNLYQQDQYNKGNYPVLIIQSTLSFLVLFAWGMNAKDTRGLGLI